MYFTLVDYLHSTSPHRRELKSCMTYGNYSSCRAASGSSKSEHCTNNSVINKIEIVWLRGAGRDARVQMSLLSTTQTQWILEGSMEFKKKWWLPPCDVCDERFDYLLSFPEILNSMYSITCSFTLPSFLLLDSSKVKGNNI